MDLKDIKAIIDLMKKNSISEFELEKQEFKIRLRRSNGGHGRDLDEGSAVPAYYPMPGVPAQLPAPASTGAPAPAAAPPSNEIEIKSPMVGTFYRAPSPEAANYAEVGAEVNADTVVCIIEAMKVFNNIKAECRGTIAKILVTNGQTVEFGQPLFLVKP